MPDLGRFLEFSVPAPDLAASLDFYLQLGFREVRVNDIRPRGYTAVTDGQLLLLEAPTFSATEFDIAPPLIGRCTELLLSCSATGDTSSFFEMAGFLGTAGDPDDTVRLAAPEGTRLQLRTA